jgi:hypothetical protein
MLVTNIQDEFVKMIMPGCMQTALQMSGLLVQAQAMGLKINGGQMTGIDLSPPTIAANAMQLAKCALSEYEKWRTSYANESEGSASEHQAVRMDGNRLRTG